jgi:hypothetical protein
VDGPALLDDQTQPPSQPNPPAAVVATNLITDLSAPTGSSNNNDQTTSIYRQALSFTLSNSLIFAPMSFNLLGCMCGPAIKSDGSGDPNPGCPVTMQITWQDAVTLPTILGSATVDLTNAIPGTMVWANNVVTTFTIGDAGNNGTIFYNISVNPSDPLYYFYDLRPCVVRNGNDWSDGAAGEWSGPGSHTQFIGVDLNLVSFDELSGNLFPAVTLNSILLRKGELRPKPFQPQIKLSGAPRIAGTLEGALAIGAPILANPGGLSGGPLWKPAKLCTG